MNLGHNTHIQKFNVCMADCMENKKKESFAVESISAACRFMDSVLQEKCNGEIHRF